MTRLQTLAFELNSVTAGVEFDAVGSGGVNTTIATSPVHSGTYSGKVKPTTTAASGFLTTFTTAGATGPFYGRFYLRIATLPGATTTIATLQTGALSNSGTPAMSIKMTSTGTLILMDGASPVGSASAALNTGQWYRIEMLYDCHFGSGSNVMSAQIDGTVFASKTNSTTTTLIGELAVGANLGNSATTTTGELYFDALAVDDATYPGVYTQILYIRPGSRGDTSLRDSGATLNAWTAFVDGPTNTGTGAYTSINEVTPDDITTYVRREEGSGSKHRGDMWKLQDPVAAGAGSSDTVKAVHVNARVGAGSNSANTGRNLLFRVQSQSTDTYAHSLVSASKPYNSTTWTTNTTAGGSGMLPVLSPATDPNTGAAWTVTGTNSLTNMQVGYETEAQTGTLTNGARLSALWVVVELLAPPAIATGTAASEKDTAHIGTATAGPFPGRPATEKDTTHPGITYIGVEALGSQTDETDQAHAAPGIDIISGEWALEAPTSPHHEFLELDITASKANPTDVGDFQFSLRQGSTTIQLSPWTSLTNTATVYTLAITNGAAITDPTDLRIHVDVRKHTDEAVTPVLNGMFLVVVYNVVETDTAVPGHATGGTPPPGGTVIEHDAPHAGQPVPLPVIGHATVEHDLALAGTSHADSLIDAIILIGADVPGWQIGRAIRGWEIEPEKVGWIV